MTDSLQSVKLLAKLAICFVSLADSAEIAELFFHNYIANVY